MHKEEKNSRVHKLWKSSVIHSLKKKAEAQENKIKKNKI